MKVLADTHLHIYQGYDLEKLLNCAFENFQTFSGKMPDKTINILFLTQQQKNTYTFEELQTALKKSGNFTVVPDRCILQVKSEKNSNTLFLVWGNQFVSSERIEVLGLINEGENLDGRPAEEIIEIINKNGGAAVLPWSPGKWSGERGKIVSKIINNSKKDSILLSDISMRAFGEPKIFKQARNAKIRILAGSDSLPLLSGEECQVAQYISVFNVPDDFIVSKEALRKMLFNSDIINLGQRNSVYRAVIRWLRLFLQNLN